MDKGESLLSVAEAAKMLNVAVGVIERWIDEGMPYIPIAEKRPIKRLRRETVVEFAKSREVSRSLSQGGD